MSLLDGSIDTSATSLAGGATALIAARSRVGDQRRHLADLCNSMDYRTKIHTSQPCYPVGVGNRLSRGGL